MFFKENILLDAEASRKIAEFERQMKAIKKAEDDLKEKILAEMESKNILKVETRGIKGKKIYVHSVDGTVQKFIVPVGRAKNWAHQILIAKNNAQYLVGGSSSED